MEERLKSTKNELAQAESTIFELQSNERTAKVNIINDSNIYYMNETFIINIVSNKQIATRTGTSNPSK